GSMDPWFGIRPGSSTDLTQVIDDPIKHPPREAEGKVELEKGRAKFELQYFQFKEGMVADLEYRLPSGKRSEIPDAAFSFDAKTKRDPKRRSIMETD
ncbi:MAG: hypothetical protein AAGB46_09795, partial [Verrucomicrobiota bacterium]